MAGTRLSDQGGMQGWVDLVGLVTYRGGVPAQRQSPDTHLSSNQTQRLTSFMQRTTLPLYRLEEGSSPINASVASSGKNNVYCLRCTGV